METYLWKHEMFSFSHDLITYFSIQWPWPSPSPMETNRKVANLKRFSLSRVPAGLGNAFSLLAANFSMKQTFSTMWNYSALCQYATHPLAIANWKVNWEAYWKVAANLSRVPAGLGNAFSLLGLQTFQWNKLYPKCETNCITESPTQWQKQ